MYLSYSQDAANTSLSALPPGLHCGAICCLEDYDQFSPEELAAYFFVPPRVKQQYATPRYWGTVSLTMSEIRLRKFQLKCVYSLPLFVLYHHLAVTGPFILQRNYSVVTFDFFSQIGNAPRIDANTAHGVRCRGNSPLPSLPLRITGRRCHCAASAFVSRWKM